MRVGDGFGRRGVRLEDRGRGGGRAIRLEERLRRSAAGAIRVLPADQAAAPRRR